MDEKPKLAEPDEKYRRHWCQFSLRTLLIGIVLLSLPLAWLSVKIREARQQAAAVAAITKLRGIVVYDYQTKSYGGPDLTAAPPGPAWLRKYLGDDFFRNIDFINLQGRDAVDADLEHFKSLTRLTRLDLDFTQVTDAGLVHLKGLTHLGCLVLGVTQVTDAGLEDLKGLTSLADLDLRDTQVTDAGLEHLKELRGLKVLNLDHTKVTDAGVARLQEALPNCTIER